MEPVEDGLCSSGDKRDLCMQVQNDDADLSDVLSTLPPNELRQLLWSFLGPGDRRALAATCKPVSTLARQELITRLSIPGNSVHPVLAATLGSCHTANARSGSEQAQQHGVCSNCVNAPVSPILSQASLPVVPATPATAVAADDPGTTQAMLPQQQQQQQPGVQLQQQQQKQQPAPLPVSTPTSLNLSQPEVLAATTAPSAAAATSGPVTSLQSMPQQQQQQQQEHQAKQLQQQAMQPPPTLLPDLQRFPALTHISIETPLTPELVAGLAERLRGMQQLQELRYSQRKCHYGRSVSTREFMQAPLLGQLLLAMTGASSALSTGSGANESDHTGQQAAAASTCPMPSAGSSSLPKGFLQGLTRLEILAPYSDVARESSAGPLAAAMTTSTALLKLRSLTLHASGAATGDTPPQGGLALAGALARLTALRHLDIDHVFESAAADAAVASIARLTGLEVLRTHRCLWSGAWATTLPALVNLTCLDLGRYALWDVPVGQQEAFFHGALPAATQLRELHLGLTANDDVLRALGGALRGMRGLRVLGLYVWQWLDAVASAEAVTDALSGVGGGDGSRDSGCGGNGVKGAGCHCSSSSGNTRDDTGYGSGSGRSGSGGLQELKLWVNLEAHGAVDQQVAIIVPALTTCPGLANLTALDLHYSMHRRFDEGQTAPGIVKAVEAVQRFPRLSRFVLRVMVSDAALLGTPVRAAAAALALHLPLLRNLQELDLGDIRLAGYDGDSQEACNAIVASLPAGLRKLRLGGSAVIGALHAHLPAHGLPCLEQLGLLQVPHDAGSFEALAAQPFVGRLKALDLSGTAIKGSETATAALTQLLLPRCTALERLALRSTPFGDEGLLQVAAVLPGLRQLRHLDVGALARMRTGHDVALKLYAACGERVSLA